MIEEIRIRDLGVIADATLSLGAGFTVVTGETGAGKTMVLSALGLLMGARSDAGAVRLGAKGASAEAVLRVDVESVAAKRALEAGAELEEYDDGAGLILARTVNSDGRSRAYVGGRSAPAGVLAEVGEKLVVVHGQSDQLRLRGAAAQREALDKFGGPELGQALRNYQATYRRWRDVTATLETLRSAERDRLREAESLQAALEEIDAVDPQPDEDEALKAEAMKLGNVEELRTAAAAAHQALVSGEFPETGDATTLVDAAKRQLVAVGAHDAELAALSERLAEVGYVLADISTELAGYASSLDSDGPGRLAEVEARRADLNVLIRKYAPTIREVLDWAATSRERLDEIGGDSDRIEQLQQEAAELEAQVLDQAGVLSALRRAAAEVLAARVSEELSALAMPDAELIIGLTPTGTPGVLGADDVGFSLRPHAGSAPRPLGKGASGGELSRVMLAIEVVLAAVDPVPTFVFDEVDAGVGGKAAVEIGRRLAMLARHVQVVVVTHLPQVAAFASHHIRVTKSKAADGGFTASDVEVLPESERVRELARMLAGQEESASAQAHAEELLLDAARTAAR
ncbi:DNA repair protein RecN (Recombination protein N) [Arthrobacter pigmenti]|uniref:DNA repair protein RecN n=1 Tax=Arthrobacter pigmenti TaxID=271432 RepID=A0A846RSG8_9MICC|nr:DNA repair protein RecN [Arthrobacter pigmenti]NJC22016.1 DNA repair protein RecN (Recombination protein N) [Arthrobacter pigmenti]